MGKMAGGKKKLQYPGESMHLAIEAVQKGSPIATAAKIFKVPRVTLLYKVKGKTPVSRKMGPETIFTGIEEQLLVDWVLKMARAGFPVTKEIFLRSVSRLAKELKKGLKFNNQMPVVGDERPVLLINDGHSTRVGLQLIEIARKENIIVKLPPHSSHLLQPLDLCVFKSLKTEWDAALVRWQRQHLKVLKQRPTPESELLEEQRFPGLLSLLYHLTVSFQQWGLVLSFANEYLFCSSSFATDQPSASGSSFATDLIQTGGPSFATDLRLSISQLPVSIGETHRVTVVLFGCSLHTHHCGYYLHTHHCGCSLHTHNRGCAVWLLPPHSLSGLRCLVTPSTLTIVVGLFGCSLHNHHRGCAAWLLPPQSPSGLRCLVASSTITIGVTPSTFTIVVTTSTLTIGVALLVAPSTITIGGCAAWLLPPHSPSGFHCLDAPSTITIGVTPSTFTIRVALLGCSLHTHHQSISNNKNWELFREDTTTLSVNVIQNLRCEIREDPQVESTVQEEIESEQPEEEEFISTIEPQLAESTDLLKMLAGYIAYRVSHPTSHCPTKQIDRLSTISRGGLMEPTSDNIKRKAEPTSAWAQIILNNTFHDENKDDTTGQLWYIGGGMDDGPLVKVTVHQSHCTGCGWGHRLSPAIALYFVSLPPLEVTACPTAPRMPEQTNTFTQQHHVSLLVRDVHLCTNYANEFGMRKFRRNHPQYTQPGSNADFPAIRDLVYCESNALEQEATEANIQMKTVLTSDGSELNLPTPSTNQRDGRSLHDRA
uniref:Uncharacterized protein n=1 Tax=Timema douglasi TaxID=61478 RepID=A0A7R8VRF2_TIMDO|nr:unnamed protein product [Timema douglasi]